MLPEFVEGCWKHVYSNMTQNQCDAHYYYDAMKAESQLVDKIAGGNLSICAGIQENVGDSVGNLNCQIL